MLILLSPAKSLDFESPAPTQKAGMPRFLDQQTAELAEILKQKKPADLAALMDISDRLAELNHERNQDFDAARIRAGEAGTKQALWAFTGDVYQGVDAPSMTAKQVERAHQRIRMLSGLYGVLAPCDLILPYRLEMGTKLANREGKDLYAFWGTAIAESLADEEPDWICNLASQEYYKAVREEALPCPVVHPVFKDESKGAYKVMGLFAKYARGLMARWIIDHNVKKAAALSGFDAAGYRYSDEESSADRPVFLRPAAAR